MLSFCKVSYRYVDRYFVIGKNVIAVKKYRSSHWTSVLKNIEFFMKNVL